MSVSLTENVANQLAIVDSLYRYAAGIDLKDKELIKSAFTEDAVSDFRPAGAKAGFEYPVLEGKEVIAEALLNSLRPIITTHSVTNPRVTIDGDKAYLEAIVEAQHLPESDSSRHYLMKNRYDVELLKHQDGWFICRVTVDNVWRTGDPAVLAGV
ncbi:nuclear transport factor 2 family protein [Pantoea sp. B65]|uniref:nuclear transport factor 2 family protein n=1 Tax=Pantoea sp. B65 TaxID=2813359 RepID=UPI0039B37F97